MITKHFISLENFPMITNDGECLVFTRVFSEFKIFYTRTL